MSIQKIEKLYVIEKLKKHEGFYDRFSAIVNQYSTFLDSGALIREIGFTPHDFSHHCYDIYEILGRILPENFYNKYNNGSNLFVLLVAVLMHDVSMSQDASGEARRKHSELGKKYIESEIFEKEDSHLAIYCGKDYAGALGDIIYSHSDIKSESGEIIQYTFEEIVDKYTDSSNFVTVDSEEINVPFLAGVLRLADELDISYNRVKHIGYKNKVNTFESEMHYKICDYFGWVQVKRERPHELYIEVYEQQFDILPECDRSTVAGQIIDRFLKVKKEFDIIYKEVLSSTKFASDGIWTIDRIVLKDESKYMEYVKKKEY